MSEFELPRLVFVGGVPRSGTSLVQKILGLHSRVFAGPEFDHLPSITELWRRIKAASSNGRQELFYSEEELTAAFRRMIRELLSPRIDCGSYDVISEKTPSNINVFDDLQELFPMARFIWVIRDPRAVVASLKSVNVRARKLGKNVSLGTNLSRDIEMISVSIGNGERFLRSHEETCLPVYYEDLVANPNVVGRAMAEFLNLEFQTEMLRTDKQGVAQSLVERDGIWYTEQMYNRPIQADSLESWREELPNISARVIEDRLARKKYDVLARYNLKRSRGLSDLWYWGSWVRQLLPSKKRKN